MHFFGTLYSSVIYTDPKWKLDTAFVWISVSPHTCICYRNIYTCKFKNALGFGSIIGLWFGDRECTPDKYYKNISSVWGWDRKKTHSKGHSLASPGLASDDKWWFQVADIYYPIITRVMDSFSCSPINTKFYVSKGSQKFLNTLISNMPWWRHFNVTMTLLVNQARLFQYFQCTALTWQTG